ncbi:uncharacterized protein LOC125441044 [Sphaerodactylus townsendi]|uniref:uncharacterized protein LOC125441044 n=1 Tax=Sphaerodactylus townsendi TaxID=933632 RepID=UPI0020270333|nr:uncharacterized protein LOC125441044 [Sphaerodactylus townsendi]
MLSVANFAMKAVFLIRIPSRDYWADWIDLGSPGGVVWNTKTSCGAAYAKTPAASVTTAYDSPEAKLPAASTETTSGAVKPLPDCVFTVEGVQLGSQFTFRVVPLNPLLNCVELKSHFPPVLFSHQEHHLLVKEKKEAGFHSWFHISLSKKQDTEKTVKVQGNDISHKLQISKVRKKDEGLYECRVTDANYGDLQEYKAQAYLKVSANSHSRRMQAFEASPMWLQDKPRKNISAAIPSSIQNSASQRMRPTAGPPPDARIPKQSPQSGTQNPFYHLEAFTVSDLGMSIKRLGGNGAREGLMRHL